MLLDLVVWVIIFKFKVFLILFEKGYRAGMP